MGNTTPGSFRKKANKSGKQHQPQFETDLSIIKSLQTIISAALVVATLFTLWTPANLFSGELLDTMLFALEDTPEPDFN